MPPGDPGVPPPATLTATGCFTDVANLVPATGVIPYELNQPFWSDGASKLRLVAPAPDTGFTVPATDRWTAATGTIFVKTFELPLTGGGVKRVETRFTIVEDDGVRGLSYRWNDEGTEAFLLETGQTDEITGVDLDDGTVRWSFPSRNQCNSCHKGDTGILGFESEQLNRDVTLLGRTGNQLDIFAAAGLIDANPNLTAFPAIDDDNASLDDRARAYLHINCTSCHRENDSTGTDVDLRAELTLAEMGICNEEAQKGNLGVAGALLLKPGLPEESLIYLRTLQEETARRMPPLATNRFDDAGSQLLFDWITSLSACE